MASRNLAMLAAFAALALSSGAADAQAHVPPPDGLILEMRLGVGGAQIAQLSSMPSHGGLIAQAGVASLLRVSGVEWGAGVDAIGLSPLSDVGGAVLGLYMTGGISPCEHGPGLGAHLEFGVHRYGDLRYQPGPLDTVHSARDLGTGLLPYLGLLLELGRGGMTHGAFGFFVRADLGRGHPDGGASIGGVMAGLSLRFGATAVTIR